MKKNIIISLICLFLTINQALAEKIIVEALQEYNSKCPPKKYSVKVAEDTILGENFTLKKGTIINGEIIQNIEPKRLKRDAYFIFLGKSIIDPNTKIQKQIFSNIPSKMQPYKENPSSKGEIAYNISKTTAGFFVKGIGYCIDFGKGIVNPKKGENRLKSGIENAYEGSVLSYCSEGDEIYIPIGTYIKMSFSSRNLK